MVNTRFLTTGYWSESKRPLVSLVFLLPMLLVYEIGILVLGKDAARNGADMWLRNLLDLVGFTQYFLLPLLTCALLLAWHHTSRHPWRFSWGVFYGMVLESILFALALFFVARVVGTLADKMIGQGDALALLAAVGRQTMANVIGYFGAGVYEELLFRLMLLPAIAGLLHVAGVQGKKGFLSAALISSLLFAAAHYKIDVGIAGVQLIRTTGDAFAWFSFLFRFVAGMFFALLFIYRGFGIAAGTHALYDILTVTF